MARSAVETVRRQNLALVLGHLHREGALSRSDLTRRTGLNRSTVAALVADLAARNLVIEEEPPASGSAGRPSPIVRPDPDVVALAVNPEVDELAVALVGMHAQVRAERRHHFSAVPSARETVDVLAALLPELIAAVPGARLIGAGVAVPGLVRAADGVVEWAPHLCWTDAPVAELLATAVGLPVAVGNDATLGAIAEQAFGAGRGVADLVYLNGGASGIGGGIVVDGRPLGGTKGFAGEFGHILVPDGPTRVEAEEAVNRDRLAAALGVPSANAHSLHRAVIDATDPTGTAEIARQTDLLATLVAAAVNILNPELVVLGGFLAALHDADPARLNDLVGGRCLSASFRQARLVTTELDVDLLLVGAAELALQPLLTDPSEWPLRAAG